MLEVKIARCEDYNIAIPKDWLYEDDPEKAFFIAPDGKCQITISVYTYDNSLDIMELKKVFEDYLNIRLQKEKESAQYDLELGPAAIHIKEGLLFTKYRGEEKTLNRFLSCFIVAQKGKLVTVYCESIIGETAKTEEFFALSEELFNTLEIKG